MVLIILIIINMILISCFLFNKIRNLVIVAKKNYREIYKNIKRDVKLNEKSKKLFKINLILIIIFFTYIVIGIIVLMLALLMSVFTMFGSAYSEAGGDTTFYDMLMKFSNAYIDSIVYFIHYISITLSMIFVRGNYIELEVYEKLKNI